MENNSRSKPITFMQTKTGRRNTNVSQDRELATNKEKSDYTEVCKTEQVKETNLRDKREEYMEDEDEPVKFIQIH